MTEVEKINNSKLGKVVGEIMELLPIKKSPELIWLVLYVAETASQAMNNMWQENIPADTWTLETAADLPLADVETYKALMQDENGMGEEYWLPMFETILGNLQAFLAENPGAEWEELGLENAWELANGPLGEMLQGL